MNAFQALAKLELSNVVAIRGNSRGLERTIYKQDAPELGLMLWPCLFDITAKWAIAYICENCSGSGQILNPDAIEGGALYITCPECDGEKMVWSDL